LLAEDEILLHYYCLQGLGTEIVLVLVLVSGVDMAARDYGYVAVVVDDDDINFRLADSEPNSHPRDLPKGIGMC
jgi:predicted DNA repair protein MutK